MCSHQLRNLHLQRQIVHLSVLPAFRGQLSSLPFAESAVMILSMAIIYWLLLAEGHLTRRLFGGMVRWSAALPLPIG
jgi:hypothetical protein